MKNQEVREEEYANLMMFDPRGGNFGRRILCMQEEFGISSNDFKLMPETIYDDYERAMGFTPTALARNKLPFQFNYDFLNAISFKKGCYLGQEIVSRSYFTGIVRRRVFPFMLDNKCRLTESQHNEIK
jgi:folate-binding protein YgfZ